MPNLEKPEPGVTLVSRCREEADAGPVGSTTGYEATLNKNQTQAQPFPAQAISNESEANNLMAMAMWVDHPEDGET